METPHSSTRVIQLTPPGRAAVAVVLVAGPDAVRIVDECLQRADHRHLADLPANRILLRRWGPVAGEELIACRRSSNSVEIHCHGGVAAVRAVIDRLQQQGCQPMHWQDWLRETAVDPIRRAAQVALADAPTARTAAVLVDQLQGSLTNSVRATLDALAADDWRAALATLDAVLAHRGVGLHLTRPWRVVLAGRPNVGKSSLMNALLGFQRAIVCDLPGTTRDVLTSSTAIDGWPIELADTAGLRETRDAIESAGVARAKMAVENADLVLVVDDNPKVGAAADLPSATPVLSVLSKIDLLPSVIPLADSQFDVRTSAQTGTGVAELVATISRALVPSSPAAGAAVPFTAEQVERLDTARAAIRKQEPAAAIACLQPLIG